MDASFLEGLAKAATMILVSEVGDKTFFVAAVMAMRHPRRWVLCGSLSALWLMTIISAAFGWAAPNLVPRRWAHSVAMLLFFGFGLRSLWEAISMKGGRATQELAEVEEELNEASKAPSTPTANGNGTANGDSHQEEESKEQKSKRQYWSRLLSPVLIQSFSLVFLGEWGDKSQIATIGLASEENVWGVALGGCLGHLLCSGAAVIGGRHLATQISERTVAFSAGILFMLFGAHALVHGPH